MEAVRIARHPAPPEDADRQLADTLETLEAAANYADWIHELLAPHLGPRVLEVGAGHGTVTTRLAREGRRVTVSEISPRCVTLLAERFRDRDDVEIVNGDLEAAAHRGPFDTVVMVNVLEHIADDEGALATLREGLAPEGRIVIFVPAFAGLYSRFDRLIGHHRRYRLDGLAALAEEAGFRVVEKRYVNALGAVVWWVFAKGLGMVPDRPWTVQAYDRLVTPVVRRVERRLRMPFGQSVLCVAEKATD